MPVNKLMCETQNCYSNSFLTMQEVWWVGTCELYSGKCSFEKSNVLPPPFCQPPPCAYYGMVCDVWPSYKIGHILFHKIWMSHLYSETGLCFLKQ
jgi:hypothetical protein